MSSHYKENLSQEEKLALWRLERDKRSTNSGKESPSQRQRPDFRPLPNHDRRASLVAFQPTPVQNHLKKPKPSSFPFQPSVDSTGSLHSRAQQSKKSRSAVVMQPTNSPLRRESFRRPRRPLSKIPGNRFSSSVTSRRKSGGLLSKPPVRLAVPSSVSSSFEQLSDQPHCFEDEGNHQYKAEVYLSSITFGSPRLPVTSPLSVFSPSGPNAGSREDAQLQSAEEMSEKGRALLPKEGDLYSRRNEYLPSEMKNSKMRGRNIFLDEMRSITDSTEERRNDTNGGFRCAIGSERDGTIIIDSSESRREDDTSFILASKKSLDEELPALNAALSEFSNVDLSFNMDSSSCDEEPAPFGHSRTARNRSGTPGPILSVPILRDGCEGKAKSPEVETQSPSELGEENSPSFILQSSLPSPFHATNAVSKELLNSANGSYCRSRPSRGKSKNLGLLLPIPSLRDDLSEKKDSPRKAISKFPLENSRKSLIPVSSPSSSSTGITSPSCSGQCEKILNGFEMVEEYCEVQPLHATRKRSERLGLLLPIPSSHVSLSDAKDTTRQQAVNPASCAPTIYSSCPLNSTLSQHENAFQPGPPHCDHEQQFMKKSARGPSLVPDEFLEVDICSPLVENLSSRRRGRESFVLPAPVIVKDDNENLPVVTKEETDDLHGVTHLGETGSSRCLDFMPLVKHKERHVLANVPEEDTPPVEVLQEQLAEVMKENRQLLERLAHYNRSYEERVTPYRDLFEEWREQKRRWTTTEASHNALVEEVQNKFAQALQLSLQKCQDLQERLKASQDRVAVLERQVING